MEPWPGSKILYDHWPSNNQSIWPFGSPGHEDGIVIPPEYSGRGSRRSRSSRSGGGGPGKVRVFLEQGDQIKVTQTAGGIFVSFDRSVVEEFRFGEQRVINIGEISAQRVSGWEGREYIVETLDKDGMKLTERFSLSEDGQLLRRHIVFRDRQMQEASMEQVFDRDPG